MSPLCIFCLFDVSYSSFSLSLFQRIAIPNISADLFLSILTFLYTGDLNLSESIVCEVFEACDLFLLEDGKNLCKEYIELKLTNEVLAQILVEVRKIDCEITRL